MIALAIILVKKSNQNQSFKMSFTDIFLLVLGSLVTILAFIQDYVSFLMSNYELSEWSLFSNEAIFERSANYILTDFNWALFVFAELILITPILMVYKRKIKLVE